MARVVIEVSADTKGAEGNIKRLEATLEKLGAVIRAQSEYKARGGDVTPLLRDELAIRKNIAVIISGISQKSREYNQILDDGVRRSRDVRTEMDAIARASKNVGRLDALKRSLGDILFLQEEYKRRRLDTKKLLQQEESIHRKIVGEVRALKSPTTEENKLLTESLDRIKGISRELRNTESAFSRVRGVVSKLSESMRGILTSASQAVSGIRMIGQGVQNLGFVLSGFVSLPLGAAMRAATSGILDYEQALVEVQKTTKLTNDGIDLLSDSLRQLSSETPTTATGLANIAADAGRMGIAISKIAAGDIRGAVDDIIEFTKVIDRLSISTTLTSEIAGEAFGRFMSVFSDLEVKDLESLGSAINELGQSASVNENEIVGAMMRIAPAAATLGMSAPEVAALATAIVQLSESMSRGGTRVRSALEKMVLDFDKAAQLMGVSTGEIKDRINKDAIGVFLDLLASVSKIEDKTQRLTVATEIFGTTGANAVQRLSGDIDGMARYLNIANSAFAKGTSLNEEFNRAMGSTKNVLDVVRNNLTDIGREFASELLPLAREFLLVLIPAIQELGQQIGSMTAKQKLMIIAIAGLLVVGPPILALLGSFAFAISMVIGGVLSLTAGIIGLAGAFLSLPGVIVVAVGAFIALLARALTKSEGDARGWGFNLIAEYAGGIMDAIGGVLQAALDAVGAFIDLFIGAHSPPKMGVLSNVTQWGRNLISAYVEGFTSADFSALRDIGQIISRVLNNLVKMGELPQKKLADALRAAYSLMNEIASSFDATGVIPEDALSRLADSLGSAGVAIARLLVLQLRYNRAVKELDAIRKAQKDVTRTYEAEVRAIQARTDLTEEEKLELIRIARERRDAELDDLGRQEDIAESNVESIKSQLDSQKEYVDYLVGSQTDIANAMNKVVSASERVARSVSGIGRVIQSALEKALEALRINLSMQDKYNEKGMDTKDLLREELSIRKRIIKAILGLKNPTQDQLALLDENISRVQELNRMLGSKGVSSDIPSIGMEFDLGPAAVEIGGLTESVREFGSAIDDARLKWELFKIGFTGGDVAEFYDPDSLSDSEAGFYDLGVKIGEVVDSVGDLVDGIGDLVSEIRELKSSDNPFSRGADAWKGMISEAISGWKEAYDTIVRRISEFKKGLSLQNLFEGSMDEGDTYFRQLGKRIGLFVDDMMSRIKAGLHLYDIFQLLPDLLTKVAIPKMMDGWDSFTGWIIKTLSDLYGQFRMILFLISARFALVIAEIYNMWDSFIGWMVQMLSDLYGQFRFILLLIATKFAVVFAGVYDSLLGEDGVFPRMVRKVSSWFDLLKSKVGEVGDEIGNIFEAVRDAIKKSMKGGINGIISLAESGINRIVRAVNSMLDVLNRALGAMGLSPIAVLSEVSIPRLASGGIVTRPTLAVVGDVPGGEAVIPLDRMPDMFRRETVVNITVNNPTVRSDDDLDRIVREINARLGIALGSKIRLAGGWA